MTLGARRIEGGLAVVAFLIAAYLTYERHEGRNAVCPIGGGGCEGREQPCVGDYTSAWVTIAVFIIGVAALALLLNAVVAKFRSGRQERHES